MALPQGLPLLRLVLAVAGLYSGYPRKTAGNARVLPAGARKYEEREESQELLQLPAARDREEEEASLFLPHKH